MDSEQHYWTTRYQDNSTGWDIGYPATPIKAYIDQLEDKTISILIPGAGNAYEAEYLLERGFKNVYVMDISELPLMAFAARNPEFPASQLLHTNFFKHTGTYDLILEQTFFCSFPPSEANRSRYAQHMAKLLHPNGKLVGLWFTFPLTENMENPPFGGDKQEYVGYLSPHFNVLSFAPCYNSIPERQGQELFGIFQKK